MYIKNLGLVVLGLAALSTSVSAQVSGRDKADLAIQKQLASPKKSGWSAVIVKTQGAPTASQEAAIVALGGDIYRHLPIINSLAVRIPSRSLGKLAALPFVSRLSSDMEVKKTDEFTLQHTGADAASRDFGLSGKGVTVAVVDSGIKSTLKDLNEGDKSKRSRILGSVSFVTNSKNDSDECGHGTHVAGIVAGNGTYAIQSNGIHTTKGIAERANLVNVRVLDEYGRGTVSGVIAGVQWSISNKARYNIRVLNLSLGHEVGESYTTDPLCQAVESAWKSGIIVVCAAGNNGRLNGTQTAGVDNEGWGSAYGSIQSPGNDPYVITVGAMKQTDGNRANDRIATYSSRGPSRLDYVLKPDIIAPGNRVISLEVNNSYLQNNYASSNGVPWSYLYGSTQSGVSICYFYLSGTSMAAPVVSGAAALLLEANPDLTPDIVKARLMVSADKWLAPDGSGDALTYGAGYLNIPAALKCDVTPTQYALSPTLIVDSASQTLSLDPSLWGSSRQALWGTQAIWGTQAVAGTQALWGAQAIWGTQAIWGNQAVWGSARQALWGNQAIWGTTSSAVDLTSTAINGEK